MSKYAPFGAFLGRQQADRVPMTFAEIEQALKFRLPPSARRHRPWWSNNPDNSAMTRVWLAAGFRTEDVDLAGERLVFARERRPSRVGDAGWDPSWPPFAGHHPAYGAMRGTITVVPGVDVTEPADPEWGDRVWGMTDWEGRRWDQPAASLAVAEASQMVLASSDADRAAALLVQNGNNKSAVIRTLHSDGWRNSRIAKAMGISDQFVSNVVRAIR